MPSKPVSLLVLDAWILPGAFRFLLDNSLSPLTRPKKVPYCKGQQDTMVRSAFP
jgi:hypothetical protein